MSEIYIYQDGVCLKVIVSSDFQTYTEILRLQILYVNYQPYINLSQKTHTLYITDSLYMAARWPCPSKEESEVARENVVTSAGSVAVPIQSVICVSLSVSVT